jgi:large subunit ribosomal protein L5
MAHELPQMLKEYREKVAPALQAKLGLKNVHQVPKVTKVVVNTSVASAQDVKVALEEAVQTLAAITGQAPTKTRALKSISNFKLREGQEIGAKVTLRGRIMWEFLERFIRIALPTIRDFRGVTPRSFDGHGNYTIGVKEQTIFPEIELEKVKRTIGFDVTICTSADTDEQGRELLAQMGMPFSGRKLA